jgi:hypothetical protein
MTHVPRTLARDDAGVDVHECVLRTAVASAAPQAEARADRLSFRHDFSLRTTESSWRVRRAPAQLISRPTSACRVAARVHVPRRRLLLLYQDDDDP